MGTRANETARPATVRRMGARQLATIKAFFLIAGVISFVLSVTLWFTDNRDEGLFVGIWVPSMWSLGALLLAGERPDA